ncbi:MAG: phosphoketolase, partial [Terriglobales bacterium]
GTVARIYFPPDANCLLALAQHCFADRNTVNLIVIDKQPQLQWLGADAAAEHCRRGADAWAWAGTPAAPGEAPPAEVDVVLAACGDIPTLETVAAAWWLRRYVPELRLRMVNVLDLMCLFPPDVHPHGLAPERFAELFTPSKNVVFAFHGYQRAVHEVIHGRPNAERFHVRGFIEQGTTTTPFDMVVLNHMSRFHLAAEAVRRALPEGERQRTLIAACEREIAASVAYAREHFEDPPEIRDWVWTQPEKERT